MTYFLETLISSGVPALFSILVIGFAAVMLGKSRRNNQDDVLVTRNPVSQLYEDLYGDQDQSLNGENMRNPFRSNDKLKLPRNAGVPAQQFIKITNLNRQLDSYAYSVKAATTSKAAAAADYRQASFRRALGMALNGAVREKLVRAEAKFLKEGAELTSEITQLQTSLTKYVVDR